MTRKRFLVSSLALGLMLSSVVPATQAASDASSKPLKPGFARDHHEEGQKGPHGADFKKGPPPAPVTDEMKKLMEKLRTAREAGDAAQVTQLRAQIKTQQETDENARKADFDTAIAGGYTTWKAFMTKQGMPADLAEKITADNFPVFVELHNTRKKVEELEKKLGIGGFAPRMMKR